MDEASELIGAIKRNDINLLRQLLANGVNPCTRGEHGQTGLHIAAEGGSKEAMETLLEAVNNISIMDDRDRTPLHVAIAADRLPIVELLIEKDLKAADQCCKGLSALAVAAIIGRREIARILLQHEIPVDAKDEYGWTALHRAARAGHIGVAVVLLRYDADIHARTKQLSTPLHCAAENDKDDMVNFLIERGADVSARAMANYTPLHRAADVGCLWTSAILVEHGADIDARDDNQATPLHRAVARGYLETARKLLDLGANIEVKDRDGSTPLHLAAMFGHTNIALLLLQRGADPSVKSNGKDTPLHLAADLGNVGLITLLLENGAETAVLDGLRLTPYFRAAIMKHKAATDILKDATLEPIGSAPTPAESPVDLWELPVLNAWNFLALSQERHQLCELCSAISLGTIHEPEHCRAQGCHYRNQEAQYGGDQRPFNRERLATHSTMQTHQPDLEALRASAEQGCHLCSLIHSGLHHSFELLGSTGENYGASKSGKVTLVYHQSRKDGPKKEELEVFCGDRFTLLPLTNVSPKKCHQAGFDEAGWRDESEAGSKPGPFHGFRPKFYARCVKPYNPIWGYRKWDQVDSKPIRGIPKLLSYMQGQLISVFAVAGKFWLAEFIYGIPAALEAHHSGYPTFGWVDSADYVKVTQGIHPSCDCETGVWEPPLIATVNGGQTRYIGLDPASRDSFNLCRRWLAECVDKHEICNPLDSGTFPLRVINVGELRPDGSYSEPFLHIHAAQKGKYATLSYRWGSGMPFVTTSKNLEQHTTTMPMDTLPKQFQDVVLVTRQLGIQYVWIDSLCIIQDSVQDWQEQSALMGQIYADAWLNISISGEANMEKGFLNKRNILNLRSCRHPSLLKKSEDQDGTSTSIPKVICANVPRHDRLQDRDVLNSRGWILQERALSRRTLHFGLHEIYWECLVHCASEREPEGFEILSNASEFDQDSKARREKFVVLRSGIQYLLNQNASQLLKILGPEGMVFPCHEERHDRWVLRNLAKTPEPRSADLQPCAHYHHQPEYAEPDIAPGQFVAAHHLWYMLVGEYSRRSLTKETDRLPAAGGLASAFAKVLSPESRYIAGIWSGDVLNGLLWSRADAWKGGSRVYTAATAPRPVTPGPPSFSWASHVGHVYFPSTYRNRLKESLKYEAQVISIDATPCGVDPLGAVSGGKLMLRGWTTAAHKLLLEDDRRIRSVYFDRDDVHVDLNDEHILCLSVRNISHGYLGEEPHATRQCLLLYPTGEAESTYIRIGRWDVEIPEPPRPFFLNGVDCSHLMRLEEPREFDYSKPPYEGWEMTDVTIL